MWHKTERAMKLLRDRNEEMGVKTVADAEDGVELEKGDVRAMVLSAYLTILPACIAALAVIIGIPVLILWLLS